MRSSERNGITLIEVIAGIALLGTLLTLVMVANAKNLRQMKAADRKRAAVVQLDNFLAAWSIHNFDQDEIESSAEQAGLLVTGRTGVESADLQFEAHQNLLKLEERRSREMPMGRVIRASVWHRSNTVPDRRLTWAEVMAP